MIGALLAGAARARAVGALSRQYAPQLASVSALTHAVGAVPVRGLFGQKFEVGELPALKREATGSRPSQWARMHQLIPGIVYGYDEEGRDTVELVYVREMDLRREVNKRGNTFMNTLFDLVIDGKKKARVLPRDFQLHPFRPKAISINWLRYRPGAYPGAKVDIPLKAINEERCPALKEGAWLLQLKDKLPVYASGPEIPDYLLMDLRNMKAGEKVMASSIELNDGLVLRAKESNFAVAKFIGSRKVAEAAADAGKDKKKGGKE